MVVAKWFWPPHLVHFTPHTGHLPFSKGCALLKNVHVFAFTMVLFLDLSSWQLDDLSFTAWMSSFWVTEIVFNCKFVASEFMKRLIHLDKVKLHCYLILAIVLRDRCSIIPCCACDCCKEPGGGALGATSLSVMAIGWFEMYFASLEVGGHGFFILFHCHHVSRSVCVLCFTITHKGSALQMILYKKWILEISFIQVCHD